MYALGYVFITPEGTVPLRGFSRLETDVNTLNLYKIQRGNTNGCFSPRGDSKKWKVMCHSEVGSSYSTQDDDKPVRK